MGLTHWGYFRIFLGILKVFSKGMKLNLAISLFSQTKPFLYEVKMLLLSVYVIFYSCRSKSPCSSHVPDTLSVL